MIESERAGLACRVLDADDARILGACMLDRVEPVGASVLEREFPLCSRQADGTVVQAPGHRLHLAPAGGRLQGGALKEIEAGIVSRRRLPLGFVSPDQFDGLRFELHALGLFEAIRIRSLVVGVCPNVGDKWPATGAAGRAFDTGRAHPFAAALTLRAALHA